MIKRSILVVDSEFMTPEIALLRYARYDSWSALEIPVKMEKLRDFESFKSSW